MMKLPTWLFFLLLPSAFIGGCVFSVPTVWNIVESFYIEEYQEDKGSHFPVLGMDDEKNYIVLWLDEEAEGSGRFATDIEPKKLEKINSDLRSMIDVKSDHDYFELISHSGSSFEATLELPTRRDTKIQSWYRVDSGKVTPIRYLSYGPGFAFYVIPYSIVCGAIVTVLFLLLFRRKQKLNKSLYTTPVSFRDTSVV